LAARQLRGRSPRPQQPERMRRIGVLRNIPADDPEATARTAAFKQTLQELGWTDGHNARSDIRSSVAAAAL
jgi:putative tryptophan/tyrosine transport system substrate-binding protein